MPTIEIIKPGLLTSIQDQGRFGLAQYAIPPSGPMDKDAAVLANLLVGNPATTSILECNFSGPAIHFLAESIISLTGADMNWKLDGQKISRNKTIKVNENSVLESSFTTNGVRAYIAIQGTWEVEKTLESTATYTYGKFGGLNGEALSKGDQIHIQSSVQNNFQEIVLQRPLDYNSITQIYFHKGPEWDILNSANQNIFLNNKYHISPTSNRMGARLIGTPIHLPDYSQMQSASVFPGVIQLPADGIPIVLLQDGPTTGGYPRIGVIDESALALFNQIRPSQEFLFVLRD